jgi:hypothetical protein
MNNEELTSLIIKELGKHRERQDIVSKICEQSTLSWGEAERLVAEVEGQNKRKIAAVEGLPENRDAGAEGSASLFSGFSGLFRDLLIINKLITKRTLEAPFVHS